MNCDRHGQVAALAGFTFIMLKRNVTLSSYLASKISYHRCRLSCTGSRSAQCRHVPCILVKCNSDCCVTVSCQIHPDLQFVAGIHPRSLSPGFTHLSSNLLSHGTYIHNAYVKLSSSHFSILLPQSGPWFVLRFSIGSCELAT